jgi:hypothetical protein
MSLNVHFHSSSASIRCFVVVIPYDGVSDYLAFQKGVNELLREFGVAHSDHYEVIEPVYFILDENQKSVAVSGSVHQTWCPYGTMMTEAVHFQVGADLEPVSENDNCRPPVYPLEYLSVHQLETIWILHKRTYGY